MSVRESILPRASVWSAPTCWRFRSGIGGARPVWAAFQKREQAPALQTLARPALQLSNLFANCEEIFGVRPSRPQQATHERFEKMMAFNRRSATAGTVSAA